MFAVDNFKRPCELTEEEIDLIDISEEDVVSLQSCFLIETCFLNLKLSKLNLKPHKMMRFYEDDYTIQPVEPNIK